MGIGFSIDVIFRNPYLVCDTTVASVCSLYLVHLQREFPMVTDTRAPSEDSSQGLGKISEQKGILGPGPADLRFSEAI